MTKQSNNVLLSETVATTILQDVKEALQRCQALSDNMSTKDVNAKNIFQVLLDKLGRQYIIYALDVVLGELPTGNNMSNPRDEPKMKFLEVIQAVSTIWHLAEKLCKYSRNF